MTERAYNKYLDAVAYYGIDSQQAEDAWTEYMCVYRAAQNKEQHRIYTTYFAGERQ